MSLVEFGHYPDAALAHIVRGRLEAEGIQAFCFDTGMNMAEGVPMLFKVRVMVLAEELDAARQVLASDMTPVEIEDEPGFGDESVDDSLSHGERQRRIAFVMLLILFGPFLLLPLAMCTARLN